MRKTIAQLHSLTTVTELSFDLSKCCYTNFLLKMKCVLIFDYLNDIVYTKYNRKFAKHINKFARQQGLIENGQASY